MSEEAMLVQILRIVNDLKDEVKENRREIQKSREIEEAHWQENLRRWEENERRWEENERRWKENDKRWEENRKLWKQYDINREKDKKDLISILTRYDIAISEQLGDPNVNKMKKLV